MYKRFLEMITINPQAPHLLCFYYAGIALTGNFMIPVRELPLVSGTLVAHNNAHFNINMPVQLKKAHLYIETCAVEAVLTPLHIPTLMRPPPN